LICQQALERPVVAGDLEPVQHRIGQHRADREAAHVEVQREEPADVRPVVVVDQRVDDGRRIVAGEGLLEQVECVRQRVGHVDVDGRREALAEAQEVQLEGRRAVLVGKRERIADQLRLAARRRGVAVARHFEQFRIAVGGLEQHVRLEIEPALAAVARNQVVDGHLRLDADAGCDLAADGDAAVVRLAGLEQLGLQHDRGIFADRLQAQRRRDLHLGEQLVPGGGRGQLGDLADGVDTEQRGDVRQPLGDGPAIEVRAHRYADGLDDDLHGGPAAILGLRTRLESHAQAGVPAIERHDVEAKENPVHRRTSFSS
jgi:hypothetical protein